MASIEVRQHIEVEVLCSGCLRELETTNPVTGRLTVEPCETCLDKAKDASESTGYARGLANGRAGE